MNLRVPQSAKKIPEWLRNYQLPEEAQIWLGSAPTSHLYKLRVVRLCSCNFIQTSYTYTSAETCRSITHIKTWVSNQRSAATFVNCVYSYTIKITQYLRPLGFFPRAAREPAHHKGVALCHKKLETHASK